LHVDVERPGEVTVEVFDALGRRVARPFAGRLSAGAHRIPFDGTSLVPGAYLVRVTTHTGVVVGRMIRSR
ncbi:MAG: T9SS type A sorting domain-containing protein, partial [Bacteroidota bacterium]